MWSTGTGGRYYNLFQQVLNLFGKCYIFIYFKFSHERLKPEFSHERLEPLLYSANKLWAQCSILQHLFTTTLEVIPLFILFIPYCPLFSSNFYLSHERKVFLLWNTGKPWIHLTTLHSSVFHRMKVFSLCWSNELVRNCIW